MKTENYWLEKTDYPSDLTSSEMPSTADIVIIGGGYTGLNAAVELRKSGVNVAVLEAQTVGWGASSRNGGMLTPGLKAPLKKIVKRYGLDSARLFWQWSLDAIDHVDRLIAEENITCHWSRRGHAALAFKSSHYENYISYVAWKQKELDYHGDRLVPREQLREEIGSDSYFGGVTDDASGGLNPASYAFGLGKAAQKHGAHIVEQTPVQRIERLKQGFRVHTSRGEITAKEVLLATNGYTTPLVRGVRNGIFPVGSYIIVTEPLSEDLQAEISPKGRMFYDSKYFLNYFRLTPDGRVLFGGRNKLTTNLDLVESAAMLHSRMIEVYPQLKDVPLTHSWSGKLGITFDLMPHIGRIKGVHYAYGYGGHGASIASYLGKEVGAYLAGTKTSSPFMEIKHPRNMIARFDQFYLPFVATYYRLLDQFT